ncbi:hypothetical protein U0070_009026 [Myodes glareolus]|uniref:Cysteine-rich interactor of PDZ three n=1 Tax=Myodes glareolus TaxID=447135 RepID=A0AAW0H8E0_MYOGA
MGEKKLGRVITPDTWKDGARNTTDLIRMERISSPLAEFVKVLYTNQVLITAKAVPTKKREHTDSSQQLQSSQEPRVRNGKKKSRPVELAAEKWKQECVLRNRSTWLSPAWPCSFSFMGFPTALKCALTRSYNSLIPYKTLREFVDVSLPLRKTGTREDGICPSPARSPYLIEGPPPPTAEKDRPR